MLPLYKVLNLVFRACQLRLTKASFFVEQALKIIPITRTEKINFIGNFKIIDILVYS